MRFGRLVVLKLDKVVDRRVYWVCQCDCGNIKSIFGSSLKCNDTRSCGCLRDERASVCNTKHGLSHSKIYKQWAGVKRRCFNKAFKQYNDYGGRGITICKQWLDFKNFYDWAIKNGYKEELTIERINNDGNYEPDNCKWATMKEQGANRRNNRIFTVNGKTDTLFNLCRLYNMHMDTVRYRLNKGMDIESALTSGSLIGNNQFNHI